MEGKKDYRKLIQIGLIAVLTVVLAIALVFHFFRRWEKKLIDERRHTCAEYAGLIAAEVENNDTVKIILEELFTEKEVPLAVTRKVDTVLTRMVEWELRQANGLEGGLYFRELDEFLGYAFPSSPPPVPVYGPPPRSYNIIREQARQSVDSNRMMMDIHSFDPAVFPLVTTPFTFREKIVGSVWVRVHIERELPVLRLKRVLNFLTVISLVGFVVMAMFTWFLQSGIKSIRRELDNTRKVPKYRLKHRGGWFGFIPLSINQMLDLIEKEYHQRQELERELQQKEKLASLGKMIAGVAHEVKTPLSVIKMRVQMWQKSMEGDPALKGKTDRESLDLVIKEINRLSDLVRRLVVFSRPIHEKLMPSDVARLMEESLTLIDFEAYGKEILLEKNYTSRLPTIMADGNSIKQVFINILTNSIESIDERGKITVNIFTPPPGDSVVIEISDDGEGIPEEIRNKIFDPFFTSKDTGAGLGLTISHKIVVTHSGTINFYPNDSRGTRCVITLPLKPENNSGNGPA